MKRKVSAPSLTAQRKARELIADVPPPPAGANHTLPQFLDDLPVILEGALAYLLTEFDYERRIDSNTAVAARMMAGVAERSSRWRRDGAAH